MKRIAVVGAGTMGNGIAHVFALCGFETYLVDSSEQSLNKGITTIEKNLSRQVEKGKITKEEESEALYRLEGHTHFGDMGTPDLIIEAIPEVESLKIDLFKSLDKQFPASTIFASNTSSISITKLASATSRQERFIGMHFMNPVPMMSLVEVINGHLTSKETTNAIIELSKKLGKIPVEAEDYAGFISNRILMPMINEAIQAKFEGVGTTKAIDQVMQLGMSHPMGPLKLADFIGLDTCLSILRVLQNGFGNPKYAPSPLLIKMVDAGLLGRKTGMGFYDWTDGKNVTAI